MIRTLFRKETFMKGMLGIMTCLMVFCFTGFISEAVQGKVTAETAKIRKEANTDSEVIGSTAKGKTVDIVGAVKDSSGTVWYKVPNGNNTYGYIRSDLIQTSDDIKVTESSSTSSSTENTTKPADTVPTAITEQQATVKESSIRIRSGASTQHDTVTSLPQGTVMKLIGEATDSAGNKWYQMTCDYNGKTVEGYVRSDLITIGAPAEGDGETAEGETSENGEAVDGSSETAETEGTQENTQAEQVTAEPEYNDYEVVYNDGEYWLYNNIDSTMMKVTEVLNVVTTANENNEQMQEQIKSNKVIIVILAVIIVLLVIAVTVLILKIKELYYDEYYDEEDEEEEEEEEPVITRKAKRTESFEEETATEKSVAAQEAGRTTGFLRGKVFAKEQAEAEPELSAAEQKAPVKKAAPRRSQNFLLDDDEFEFEFLNMDDKDL